jgi:glycosyltransferase involved in cell wall biosynthesis
MADRLADMGVPSERTIVKPHFVEDPGPRPRAPSTSGDILVIGRLAQGKGVDTLLAAWSATSPRHPDQRLCVIGDGPLARQLAEDAPARVEMLGWRDRADVTARLLSARALVAPSELYETFGMVLVEAMSAGVPVIVTTAAGAAAIVEPPADLVVPPRQAAALADALEALDDVTVDAVGAANRRRFEQHYSESVGVAALEAAYREAIAAGRSDAGPV